MKTRVLNRDLTAAFESFERSAWRLASLDVYDVPEESASVRAWIERGELIQPDNGWPDLVRARTANGGSMGRVQIVTRPAGDYMTYLLASYRSNVEAGEDVRIAVRDLMPPDLAGVREDFWVFDDEVIFVLNYDRNGAWLGAVDDSANVARYLDLQARMIAGAEPYQPAMDDLGR